MQKTVLLAGRIGETYGGGKVDTRNVFVKQSFYGEGFKLIDTPGFSSIYDVFDLNAGVLSAIDNFLINRIMLVIRYDRISDIETQFIEYIQFFKGYENKVTIVITFLDQVEFKDKEQMVKEISHMLNNYNMNSIIFTSCHDSGEKLCELFDLQLKNSVAQKIQLTDDQQLKLLNHFDDEQLDCEIMFNEYSLLCRFRNGIKQILYLMKYKNDNYNDQNSAIKEISVKLILEIFYGFNEIMYGQEESQKYLIYQTIKNFIIESFFNFLNKLKQQDQKDFEQFLEIELKYYEVGRDECLKELRQAKMRQSQKMIIQA